MMGCVENEYYNYSLLERTNLSPITNGLTKKVNISQNLRGISEKEERIRRRILSSRFISNDFYRII
jgi:hypothetical protein